MVWLIVGWGLEAGCFRLLSSFLEVGSSILGIFAEAMLSNRGDFRFPSMIIGRRSSIFSLFSFPSRIGCLVVGVSFGLGWAFGVLVFLIANGFLFVLTSWIGIGVRGMVIVGSIGALGFRERGGWTGSSNGKSYSLVERSSGKEALGSGTLVCTVRGRYGSGSGALNDGIVTTGEGQEGVGVKLSIEGKSNSIDELMDGVSRGTNGRDNSKEDAKSKAVGGEDNTIDGGDVEGNSNEEARPIFAKNPIIEI